MRYKMTLLRGSLLSLLSVVPLVAASPGLAEQARSILAEKCLTCHGAARMAGLDLRDRAAMLQGGNRGPAVVLGHPEESLLYQASAHQGAIKMPPGNDKPLPHEDLEVLGHWIRSGAPWSDDTMSAEAGHWAFRPIQKVKPPEDPSGWSKTPVDQFMVSAMRDHGVQPVSAADKRTLLRRVYFDLIGLPPAPEDVTAFLADETPEAYQKVVDRLLASPRYGERWGRYWMDVVRYADTAGDNADYPVPEARLYRDYIIDAFNADKPYDTFVQEQIAGDILAREGPQEDYAERVIATGFLALSRRYGTAPFEFWHLTMEDQIDTVGNAFLGLSLRCARCHDHKFDPVTNEDYYALYGVFDSTQYPYAGSEEFKSKSLHRTGFVPLLPPQKAEPLLAAYQQQMQPLKEEIEQIEKNHPPASRILELDEKVQSRQKKVQDAEQKGEEVQQLRIELESLRSERQKAYEELRSHDPALSELPTRLKDLREDLRELQKSGLPPNVAGAYAVQEGEPKDVALQILGDPQQKGAIVQRRMPRFLGENQALAIPEGASGRLQLARWLGSQNNPLTARVMVNRIWQHHFGRGIVRTPSNFGTTGEPPSHPELLDWLADYFVQNGWSVKAVHRLIVRSKTYQLASTHEAANAAKDGPNHWYWRFERNRLDAEAIRDAMLTAAGELDLARPSRHPFPSMKEWKWTQHEPFKAAYASKHRSVYLMTQRIQRHPYLAVFDGPDTNYSTGLRTVSTVPLQALYLMNSSFVDQQARRFAERLLAAAEQQAERIDRAHQIAWGRPATDYEIVSAGNYIQRYERELKNFNSDTASRELEAWTSFVRVMITANEFSYVD